MVTRRWVAGAVLVATAFAAVLALYTRGVAQREVNVRNLAERLKSAEIRHSLLLEEVRDAAEARAETESKLREVDSILENMNADIAVAHLHRERIDLRVFELNQRQHELLAKDLADQRKRLAEIQLTSANAGLDERRIGRDIALAREHCWCRYAFW